MLTVLCGTVRVTVPNRFSALVARYAQFTENWTWVSDTSYQTWLQLPGVVVER